jgi:hypothetical protein
MREGISIKIFVVFEQSFIIRRIIDSFEEKLGTKLGMDSV